MSVADATKLTRSSSSIVTHGEAVSARTTEHETVSGVLWRVLRHPVRVLVGGWNWKAALLSSSMRAGIYFVTNYAAGFDAALAAMSTEFAYRAVTSGSVGALIESFRRARPMWRATLVVSMLLPLISHTMEFAVHHWRGTARLQTSIVVSVSFTMLSALFNLHAMRRGVLIVGAGRSSFLDDMRRMPLVVASFLIVVPATLFRWWWSMHHATAMTRTRTTLLILWNDRRN